MSISRAFKGLAERSLEAAGLDLSALRILLSVVVKLYMGMVLIVILSSSSIRDRIAGFLMNSWGVLSTLPAVDMIRGLAFWLLANLILFVLISVWITWKYIWHASKKDLGKYNTDIPRSVAKWFFIAVADGPRLAVKWLRDGFVMDMLAARKFASRTEKIDALKNMSIVLNTYEDMRFGVATNKLTLGVYALGAASAIVWGLYPFVYAIKQNIAITSAMLKKEPDIMSGIKAIEKSE